MSALAGAVRGMVFIHAAPKALCPHIEWAVGRALGDPAPIRWEDQPVLPGARRAEVPWEGREGSGAAIASALLGSKVIVLHMDRQARPFRYELQAA